MVKLTGLTGTQLYRVEDYLSLSESSSDKRVVREAKSAILTKTTVTLSYDLAADLVEFLPETIEDQIGMVCCDTEEQCAFAERSVRRSIESLVVKVEKAMKGAS